MDTGTFLLTVPQQYLNRFLQAVGAQETSYGVSAGLASEAGTEQGGGTCEFARNPGFEQILQKKTTRCLQSVVLEAAWCTARALRSSCGRCCSSPKLSITLSKLPITLSSPSPQAPRHPELPATLSPQYAVECSQIHSLPTITFVINGTAFPLRPSAYILNVRIGQQPHPAGSRRERTWWGFFSGMTAMLSLPV